MAEEFALVRVPLISDDDISRGDPEEILIETKQGPELSVSAATGETRIPGVSLTFYVPFDGPPWAFTVTPTALVPTGKEPPRIYAIGEGRHLVIVYESTDPDPVKAQAYLEDTLAQIRWWLKLLEPDFDLFNEEVRQEALARVKARRARLEKNKAFAESLPIPIRRKEDPPEVPTVPTVPKEVPLQRGRLAGRTGPGEDWTLPTEEYEHMLGIMSDMGLFMEKSPETFRHLGEEDLRMFFLLVLNGHYKGRGTAETFNLSGKTDVLIQWEGKAAFVAEFKFWKGAQSLRDTVNQLLGYTTWRNTKTAIVLFNQRRNFSAVLDQIPEVVESHPSHERTESNGHPEGTFRFVLHHPDDPDREIIVTVLAFEVPPRS